MSESERIPGYLNRSQVPPRFFLLSRTKYFLLGKAVEKWQATPTPDNPAPIITKS